MADWTLAQLRTLKQGCDERWPLPLIVERTGHPPGSCRRYASARGWSMSPGRRPWTEEEDGKLRALVASGKTYAQIGRVLGRTMDATHRRAERIGARPQRITRGVCADAYVRRCAGETWRSIAGNERTAASLIGMVRDYAGRHKLTWPPALDIAEAAK